MINTNDALLAEEELDILTITFWIDFLYVRPVDSFFFLNKEQV